MEAKQFLVSLGEPGRLSPPIWPCTTRGFPCLACCQTSGGLLPHLFTLTTKAPLFDDEQVSLPPVTEAFFRGGLFSVALSVNRNNFRLAAAPSQIPWRYQARCPFCLLTQTGVRTFLPFTLRHAVPKGEPSGPPSSRQASDRPAHPPTQLYLVSCTLAESANT